MVDSAKEQFRQRVVEASRMAESARLFSVLARYSAISLSPTILLFDEFVVLWRMPTTPEARRIEMDSDNIHERMHSMGISTATRISNSDFLLLDSTAVSLFAVEHDHTVNSRSRTDRQEVQSRKRQVTDGWSKQERAARLRAGIARRAWLLNSIEHI